MARLSDGLSNRLYLDPIFKGSYPADVIDGLGVSGPSIRPGDMEAIRAPIDFLGVNYYMRFVVKADPTGRNPFGEHVRVEGAECTAMDWEIYPEGLRELLARVHRDYAPAVMYVTENGAAFDDVVGPDGRVRDERRRAYLEAHFAQAARAIADGAPCRAISCGRSWTTSSGPNEGYDRRFGLVYVDYDTQERTVKDSGRWYADMLHG